MQALISRSIKYIDGKLSLLDQRLLPNEEKWQAINSIEDILFAIQSLQVRGAPAIGIAATLFLSQMAQRGDSFAELVAYSKQLKQARPTAINLVAAIDRVMKFEQSNYNMTVLQDRVTQVFIEDKQLCESIATNGECLITDGNNVLTYCNTGSLATSGSGTAIGIIRKAFENGKNFHVYVSETRPLLQGARLTAWELAEIGVPHTLICDNMAATLMSQEKIDKVLVGADRVAINGDVANKIGTYNMAVISNFHGIPFYVAAPYTTVDIHCKCSEQIPIELRDDREVRGFSTHNRAMQWAPADTTVFNPAFDLTPARLISAWVLDTGLYSTKDVKNGCLRI